MRRIAVLAIIFLTVFSCKNEKGEADVHVRSADTAAAVVEKITIKAPQRSTAEMVGTLVSEHQNDTLYVTNFFATWCGPCVREIPHFSKKMNRMKDQPVKFTFVSLDDSTLWDTEVKNFTADNGIGENTLLLDPQSIKADFFKNFSTWQGDAIPFTILRKGKNTKEILGSVSAEVLGREIAAINMP